ncbi:trypsin-like peptidase domain-containing protein [Dactylosporangium sp. NPDC049525]|uniref:trypsin-like peptidase domain-containing protein n=1 Tax=Dactylosporangium sp. NPDC049525 TaxID=3154730 RepID=UPI00343F6505
MDMMPPRPDYVPVADLTAALDRAADGVVLVVIETEASVVSGTGWLITDDLVVTTEDLVGHRGPRSARRGAGVQVLCRVGTETTPADVVYSPAAPFPSWSDVALLRLRRSIPGRSLPLAGRGLVPGEPVFLVHLPRGKWEPQVSFGRLDAAEAPVLVHDAEIGPGSVGAPLFSMRGDVVGMTIDPAGQRVAGVTVGGLLEVLQDAPGWNEIVEHHHLVDWAAFRTRLETAGTAAVPTGGLLWCAVRWSIDPADLADDARDAVRPLVNDPAADRWVMRAADRQRILAGAGSLDTLRAARGTDTVDDPRQQAVDRILAGPPFAVDELTEEALPLWLQAVRWFAGTVPGLPTAATVNRLLERRRLRGRLAALTRPHFWGRQAELRTLATWYGQDEPPPMTLTGIGGIGKSCLAARFAGDLPGEPVLLWLDFDRADLAPDDAGSVLTALAEQLSVQVDVDLDPGVDGAGPRAGVFGAELHRTTAGAPPPLLVLDGFEIAQHAERHGEVWRLVDLVLARVPRLRVLIVGRAPVHALTLGGRPAERIALEGLDDAVATEWLRRHDVTDADVLARVLRIAHGVPLVLQLAQRLIANGGSVDDLPKHLVEGFLYRRILDRVVDPDLQPIARDALVLRRVTPDIIADVLPDSRPAGVDAAAVFRRLAQELALVTPDGQDVPDLLLESGPDVLRLRPEVRVATLALLARDNADRVREIDTRAAEWYSRQPPTDVTVAELVYHRLRLDDVAGAAAVWRDAVAPLLQHAADDLRPAARAWLSNRLNGPAGTSANLAAWERNAAARIRDVLSRGLVRLVPDILAEHEERGPQSTLVLYDAWSRWAAGDIEAARSMLAAAPKADGPVGRNRTILAALMAREIGRRASVDALLATVASDTDWQDSQDPELMTLAVWAARVRLAVDLPMELSLLRSARDDPGARAGLDSLRQGRVVLPALDAAAQRNTGIFRDQKPLTIPLNDGELQPFADAIAMRLHPSAEQVTLREWLAQTKRVDVWQTSEWSVTLMLLHWRRLALVTDSTALGRVCARALREDPPTRLAISVVATLFALRGNDFRYVEERGTVALDDIVEHFGVLNGGAFDAIPQTAFAEELAEEGNLGTAAAALYLTGPDPLEELLSVVAGLPVAGGGRG